MVDPILSKTAKKRFGSTKKERSERARAMAILKHSRMSKAERTKHGKLMRAAHKKKKIIKNKV